MGYGIAVVAILSTLSATKYVYKDLPMMIGIYKGKVSFGLCFSVVLEKKKGGSGGKVYLCVRIYIWISCIHAYVYVSTYVVMFLITPKCDFPRSPARNFL